MERADASERCDTRRMVKTASTSLVYSRSFELEGGDRHALARGAARGTKHRIRRGAYVSSDAWARLSPTEQYRLRCVAESGTRSSRPILSHFSAAAVHGVPIVGDWPREVHRVIERTSGGRSRDGVTAHPTRLAAVDVVEIDGMLVTSLARTVVDLASTSTFVSAVASADFALHRKRPGRLQKVDLENAWNSALPIKSHARAERILRFATDLSDSVAESASRANMYLGGFVMPKLQSPYYDVDGLIGYADFDWQGYDHLGESDGKAKYIKDEFLNGRSPGEVVYAEKLREDRFRALNKKVSRWDWHRAIDLPRLRKFLLNAGVPLRRRA
jgi:hypothetical protein